MSPNSTRGGSEGHPATGGNESGNRTSIGRRRTGRRRFLAAAAGGTTAALAGCAAVFGGGGGGDGFEGETLRVSVWSGVYADYFNETVKPMFEEETGANIKAIPGWSEIISKIESAPEDDPPYDVTVTEGQFYFLGRNSDLFEQVPVDEMSNLEDVYPYLKEFRTHEYGVPVDGAPVAIMYDESALDWTPEEWTDLQQQEAKTAMDGGFYVYPTHIGAIVADEKPGIQEMYDENTHDVPFEVLGEMNIDTWYSSGAERWNYIKQGVINLVQSYYGVAQGKARDEENISVVLPDVTTGYFDHYCVVRGTDKRDLGFEFLDFLLRDDVQTEWTQSNNNLMSNSNVEYSDLAKDVYPQSNDEYGNFKFPDWNYLSDYSTEFSERFKRLKSE